MRCEFYCGVACVSGSCPIALRDEYAERGYDTVKSCAECPFYEGCADCAFEGEAFCPRSEKAKNEEDGDAHEEREARWKGAGLGDYYCSLCQHTISGRTRFCPECGAKMDAWEDGSGD